MIAYSIMSHPVSGCFGTSLSPRIKYFVINHPHDCLVNSTSPTRLGCHTPWTRGVWIFLQYCNQSDRHVLNYHQRGEKIEVMLNLSEPVVSSYCPRPLIRRVNVPRPRLFYSELLAFLGFPARGAGPVCRCPTARQRRALSRCALHESSSVIQRDQSTSSRTP